MLLESIKLHNFRQYKDAFLDFAQDIHGKNVTIIIGENGSGKTTFLQSFFWCLYGVTNFKDSIVLNKTVASEMTPSFPVNTSVEINLQHGDVHYKITRTQRFKKDLGNNVKVDGSSFCEIEKKDKTGNKSFVDASKRESTINFILRKELSRYFFFDGERIETMGKEISSYKKSEEFAEAVEGLLGLKGMQKALEHLNGGPKNSVIGKYNQRYDSASDSEVRDLTNIINECDEEIEKREKRIEEIDKEDGKADEEKRAKQEELKGYKSSRDLQERKESLEKNIKQYSINKADAQKDICREFNNQATSFLSLGLIKPAFDMLVKLNLSGSDIPNITDKTIQYLLDHHKCLCGTCLSENSSEVEELKKWFDVLPPKSIGSMVNDFKMMARNRLNSSIDFISFKDDKNRQISVLDDQITDAEDVIANEINPQLNGKDVEEIVQEISATIAECERIIRKHNDERNTLNQEIGAARTKREEANTKRKDRALASESNRKIEVYKAYAQYLYDSLFEKYSTSEAEVRTRLENNMNEIFSAINNGDFSVKINQKYQIDVIANNVNDKVELSEGQSISVIFSFITSMIKMSRENRLSPMDHDLSSDIYPLVMDAPLSKFDKKHIKSVCETIPHLTEQVIIFIKDTDGDLAREYMSEKIGKSHRIRKVNETETILE
ncbi:MAG: AAA family ATPase [Fibrobacter sp.]|uniref:AAA family ATPase n=1 Tax=Fibrobacter sp. TaxID=35828 RepID=UPI001AFF04E2|nr:AAA family ATPase [Fibrobacter sp.]MBO7059475.1 AAA family ATPase [Fibrobacter sp.]